MTVSPRRLFRLAGVPLLQLAGLTLIFGGYLVPSGWWLLLAAGGGLALTLAALVIVIIAHQSNDTTRA